MGTPGGNLGRSVSQHLWRCQKRLSTTQLNMRLSSTPCYLQRSAPGANLAYHHMPGCLPGVLFCPGFRSVMSGMKALALEDWCQQSGRQITRFDYTGHGQSSGDFSQGTVGVWTQDALDILEHVTQGPQVLVGASMGGWIALLVALRAATRVVGVVGVGAAP